MASSKVPVSVHKATLSAERGTAIHLRRAGRTYDEIADEMGVDTKRARKLVEAAMVEHREQVATAVSELRALEAARLDAMQAAVWPEAMDGRGFAIDRVLRIMERRARLLGLDTLTERYGELTPEQVAIEAQLAIQQAMATSAGA